MRAAHFARAATLLAAIVALGGASASAADDGIAVTVVWSGSSGSNGRPLGELVISNRTASAISHLGYAGKGAALPIYRLEVHEGGKWRDRSLGWCGLGLGPHEIGPGRASKTPLVELPIPKDGAEFRWRVSVVVRRVAVEDWKTGADERIHSPVYVGRDGRLAEEAAPRHAPAR